MKPGRKVRLAPGTVTLLILCALTTSKTPPYWSVVAESLTTSDPEAGRTMLPEESGLTQAAPLQRHSFEKQSEVEWTPLSQPFSSPPSKTVKPNKTNFTHRLAFLDGILEGYDKRAWPTYGIEGAGPTQVEVNMYVNSLGSVNAANMEYSMDIYLRQSWLDRRLDLGPYNISETLTLNGEDIVSRIWKPDLFFRNVKQANFHHVTVPNILIKMAPDGKILYSMRLTLRLSCHMSFRNYPLDTQKCHVILGAYAHTTEMIVIRWQGADPIVIERPVEVPEFDLVDYKYGNFTRSIDTGSFSFLNATFILQRQNGYHVVQTYLPTFLIVMISWVSFWLNVDASPARVTLGVTTLLTLTTVASGVRTQLPPVSYVKAIDVWIGACSIMVFGALLEFALVNFLSRSNVRSKDIRRSLGLGLPKETTEDIQGNSGGASISIVKNSRGLASSEGASRCSSAVSGTFPRSIKMASTVDRISRVTFPFMFFVFNAIYWPYYMYVPDAHTYMT